MKRCRAVILCVFCVLVGFARLSAAASVTVAWDPNSDPNITGYRVWYGTRSGSPQAVVDTPNVSAVTIDDLAPGYIYYFSVQAMAGSVASPLSGEVAVMVDAQTSKLPVNDFNNDGAFDLVWQNTADGRVSTWLMSGTSMIAGLLLEPGQVNDTNWKIVGRGDFNGDGQTDIIWQHQTTGQVSAWLMNGLELKQGVMLTPSQVTDVNWKIVGVGDFNGDEKPDLVWQHQTQGLVSVWLMNGTVMTHGLPLSPDRVTDLNWKIVGVGDLNDDGHSDLIWRHETTGMVSTWLMNGTRMLDGVLLTPSVVSDLHWRIRSVGDLNGDGQPDLIWQHDQQGWITAWLMKGTTMEDGVYLDPAQVPDLSWRPGP